jgi:hypothetical protein
MKLIDDWRTILRRAWSVRLMILAFALTAAEVILPLYADDLPRGLFAVLSGLAVAGAFVARLAAQRGFDD